MIFDFGISHKASVQTLFPLLGGNCCQFAHTKPVNLYACILSKLHI